MSGLEEDTGRVDECGRGNACAYLYSLRNMYMIRAQLGLTEHTYVPQSLENNIRLGELLQATRVCVETGVVGPGVETNRTDPKLQTSRFNIDTMGSCGRIGWIGWIVFCISVDARRI